MFGRSTPESVRIPYADFRKPGVRFLRETVTAIDAVARRVTTDVGVHEADVLVVALGADYDFDATPGLAEGGNEFYSVAGAERLRELLPTFERGRAIVGVCGAPFKCPPAPSEAALLLHDSLVRAGGARRLRDLARDALRHADSSVAGHVRRSARGVRGAGDRVRAGPASSRARPDRRGVIVLDDGEELPFDLFLGVPKHRAPDVVLDSGHRRGRLRAGRLANPRDALPGCLRGRGRRHRRRAEGGRVLGGRGSHRRGGTRRARPRRRRAGRHGGQGSCYVEFGAGRVGRVDIDFLSGPKPTGTFREPSGELVAEKKDFGASRRARWFG